MRLLKKLSALLLAGIILFSLCSCSSPAVHQLKDEVLVQGVGVDYKDNEFEVTLQVLDISKAGVSASESKGNLTTTYSSKGDTVASAITNGQKVLDRDTFLAQNKLIVLGEEVAKKYLDQVLDFFVRSKTCRPDVQVAVTTDTAKEIMESKCKDAEIPAQKIQNTIINGEFNGKSVNHMIMDVVNDMKNPVTGYYLPVVKLFEEGENVTVSGVAVFNPENEPGYLDDEATSGLLWAKNKMKNATLVIDTDNFGKVTLRVVISRSRVKLSVKDNRIQYQLKIKCFCNISEMEQGINKTMTQEDLNQIQERTAALIQSQVKSALDKSLKEYQCDAFDIGRRLSQQEYGFYKKIKDNYTEQLPFVQYEILPNVKVKRLDNEALED